MTLPLHEVPSPVIDKMIACAERLMLCLMAEGEALLGETPAGLERICAAKLAEVRALQALGAPLVGRSGTGVQVPRPVADIQTGSFGARAGARWQELESMLARCDEANRANGVMLDQRRRSAGALLAALTRHHTPVYGRAGYVSASLPGRVSGCA